MQLTLPAREDDWFREQFEKDLKFFQLFLLLINRSCPIKRIDLVWTEDGPAGRVGLRQKLVCTEQALAGPCARLLSGGSIPEPVFCNRMEACGVSDKTAEKRVRASRRGEAYTCHAGLVDIAVPVFSENQHIATLLTGQVRRTPPEAAELETLRLRLAGTPDLDWQAVQESYWAVPVVTEEDIRSTIEVLEVFAEYLGNIWTRLSGAVRDQQRKARELQLARKEFAHLVLEGGPADRAALQELMGRLGYKRYPNQVLVVKLETEEEYHTASTSFDLALARAVQDLEDFCETLPNTSCAYLGKRGLCVFFRERGEAGASAGFRARHLASQLLRAVARNSDLKARVGIGGTKESWHHLADSYQEACVALASGSEEICCYRAPAQASEELAASVAGICRFLSEGRLPEARAAIASLPLHAGRTLGEGAEGLASQRHFFAYALDSFLYAARSLHPDIKPALPPRGEKMPAGSSAFELRQAFQQEADALLGELRRFYAGKREKLIERACRRIETELSDPATAQTITISEVASRLGISPGHLSRLFKRSLGVTFERYLMTARIEMSKRLLLEPLNSVADISERFGFSDPTYFSKVFRKIMSCSPSEFRENPARYCAVSARELSPMGES